MDMKVTSHDTGYSGDVTRMYIASELSMKTAYCLFTGYMNYEKVGA